MSYVKPAVPTFTGLKNIDLRLQNMAAYIGADITWLDYSFGLADRITQQRDEPYTFPAAWMSNTIDPFDCMPNDQYTYSFWLASDLTSLEYPDEYSVNKVPLIQQDVSVVFFVDLRHVSKSSSYNITRSQCRQDIMDSLNAMSGVGANFTPTGYIENDMADIYDGFSIEAIDNQKKELPFWAIRVNGTLSFRPDCV